MHGVKRTRISPEAAEAKRLKELTKVQSYTALRTDVLALKKDKVYTMEALGKTNELLDLNPEFYTVWNYRRDILTNGLFPSATPEELFALLASELKLTISYLRIHPKVYWIWTHRKWCLERIPTGPGEPGSEGAEGWKNEVWRTELGLDEKMLEADARNFHAWDYRRYVLASLPESFKPPRSSTDELRYTTKKIEASFSNFSAWHYRTKILGSTWAGLDGAELAKQKDKEFELVTQALWTDPGDSSGWLYHRWLIGTEPSTEVLQRELASIRELHDAEPDSKWCMNALAMYTLLLAHILSASGEDSAKVGKLRAEGKAMYDKLEKLDSFRKNRYRDLAAEVGRSTSA